MIETSQIIRLDNRFNLVLVWYDGNITIFLKILLVSDSLNLNSDFQITESCIFFIIVAVKKQKDILLRQRFGSLFYG